jgi:hypothetical protein
MGAAVVLQCSMTAFGWHPGGFLRLVIFGVFFVLNQLVECFLGELILFIYESKDLWCDAQK